MAELKTTKNKASVSAFIASIPDAQKRKEAAIILKLMRTIMGVKPAMWGASLIGFGTYRYKYASGREGDWPIVAFSPRKQNLTVYIMAGFTAYKDLMAKLGKYKITGGSCLYIKKLEDVDLSVLKKLIAQSARDMKKRYK